MFLLSCSTVTASAPSSLVAIAEIAITDQWLADLWDAVK